jgi:hypothetical protein
MLWDLGCVLGRKFPELTWENETHLRLHARVHYNDPNHIDVVESINVAPPGGRSLHYMSATTQTSYYIESLFEHIGFKVDNACERHMPTTLTARSHPKGSAHMAIKAQGLWRDLINALPDID